MYIDPVFDNARRVWNMTSRPFAHPASVKGRDRATITCPSRLTAFRFGANSHVTHRRSAFIGAGAHAPFIICICPLYCSRNLTLDDEFSMIRNPKSLSLRFQCYNEQRYITDQVTGSSSLVVVIRHTETCAVAWYVIE